MEKKCKICKKKFLSLPNNPFHNLCNDVDCIDKMESIQKDNIKKKCKICKSIFITQRWKKSHIVCSPDCAIKNIEKIKIKKEEKIKKEKLDALKTRKYWLKMAQFYFNKYIRERDLLNNEPCISCNLYKNSAHDAGHYRAVNSAKGLRFNEDNCHRQCVQCNQHLSGNLINYRMNLLKKIGKERLDFLENYNERVVFSIDQAKEIITKYKEKVKILKKNYQKDLK